MEIITTGSQNQPVISVTKDGFVRMFFPVTGESHIFSHVKGLEIASDFHHAAEQVERMRNGT